MTTFATGRQAEAVAAEYLENKGYRILEQNYRTRWCEIDIVAAKDNVIHFVEVKYRQNDSQGSGLEYITPKKLHQMALAAEIWLTKRPSTEHCLAAIEVSGDGFTVTEFLDNIII